MATAAEPIPVGRQRARTAAKWTGIGLIGLVALILLFFVWLNSSLGHRYVVRQINELETVSGLDIDVGRIEGSLFGELKLTTSQLKDPKGRFFVAPEATVDWRPLAYFRNHIDIKRLEIPSARLYRLPELKPATPMRRCFPTSTSTSALLEVARIQVDPAVTGYRHLLSLSGSARIDNGRGQLALDSQCDRRARAARRRQARASPRRRARGEPARHGGPDRSAGQRLRRQACGLEPAAGRDPRRQRHLDQLEGPGEGAARRQGVGRSRRRRPRRHLHRHRPLPIRAC
jgi:autotransporter translocation and assembly factor TamB